MIKYHKKKITANQLAKILVQQDGESASYWHERIDMRDFTELEIKKVSEAINKQQQRVFEFLGIHSIDY